MIFSEAALGALFVLSLSVFHLLGEEFEELISGYKQSIVSFGAGTSIAYIFLQLLPEFHRNVSTLNNLFFIFPLIGFSLIHLMEKCAATSELSREKIKRDYGEIHSGFILIYNGALGYLIASLADKSVYSATLFFLPILLHVLVSSISVSELHEEVFQNIFVKMSISFAPIIGLAVYKIGVLDFQHFVGILGVVAGMFTYIVIRDSIPKDGDGRPIEYVAGALVYTAVIIVSTLI